MSAGGGTPSLRFADRVRIDTRYDNAVFPHFDAAGLCGYEIKNHEFTGFAAGGEKGLWLSHTKSRDRRLVLAESAIDALSHAALFPDAEDQTRYASLGGKPNVKQPGLVQTAIAKLPVGAEIVAAFDADEAGRMLVDRVSVAVARVMKDRKEGLDFQKSPSRGEGDDWNHVLQEQTCQNSSRQGKTNSCPG